MQFIDQQELDYRKDNPRQDIDGVVGMKAIYYHLVSEKSKDPERKNGVSGTPCVLAAIRKGPTATPFFVDLAFETDVPEIFILLENLEVDGLNLQPLLANKEEQELLDYLSFVDFKNRAEIIETVNDAHNPRNNKDYEKFRGQLLGGSDAATPE